MNLFKKLNPLVKISTLLLVFMISATTIFATVMEEYELTEIVSEYENNLKHTLILQLNSNGDINALIDRTSEGDNIYPVSSLINGDNIVLVQSSSFGVIMTLRSNSFTAETGGVLNFIYKTNTFTGTYGQSNFYISRSSTGEWELYTEDDEFVNNMTFVANYVSDLVLVGIKTIDVNSELEDNEYQLTEIDSEYEDNLKHSLILQLSSSGNILALIDRTSEGDNIYPVSTLINGNNIVLVQNLQGNIMNLVCTSFTADAGGVLNFIYFTNTFSETYGRRNFYISRTSNDEWELYTDEDEHVNNMTFVSNYLVDIILLGIKNIDVNAY